MTLNSFFKSPLFLGLCITLGLKMAGISFVASSFISITISTLYTVFYRQELTRSFKLWTIGAASLCNGILSLIWKVPPYTNFTPEVENKILEAGKEFLIKLNELFGHDVVRFWLTITVITGIIALSLFVIALTYVQITLGNKLGLLILKNQSEK